MQIHKPGQKHDSKLFESTYREQVDKWVERRKKSQDIVMALAETPKPEKLSRLGDYSKLGRKSVQEISLEAKLQTLKLKYASNDKTPPKEPIKCQTTRVSISSATAPLQKPPNPPQKSSHTSTRPQQPPIVTTAQEAYQEELPRQQAFQNYLKSLNQQEINPFRKSLIKPATANLLDISLSIASSTKDILKKATQVNQMFSDLLSQTPMQRTDDTQQQKGGVQEDLWGDLRNSKADFEFDTTSIDINRELSYRQQKSSISGPSTGVRVTPKSWLDQDQSEFVDSEIRLELLQILDTQVPLKTQRNNIAGEKASPGEQQP